MRQLRHYSGSCDGRVELDAGPLRVAALRDIIRSKAAANRERRRKRQLAALRRESERDLREQIHRLLSQPMSRRTHFLRVRLPGGGSAL